MKSEEDKRHVILLLRGIKKIVQMNLQQNRNRVTAIENKLTVTKGESWGRRRGKIKREPGIDIHTNMYKTDDKQGHTL